MRTTSGKAAEPVVRELDAETFQRATATGVVLVDFWAPWCGPCQMQGLILKDLAAVVGPAAVIAKVNVDENPGLAEEFGIRSIPTMILFREGRVARRFVGFQSGAALLEALL